MSHLSDVVLPQPGIVAGMPQPPIPGPAESSFVHTFGTLLPPATYLPTRNGKAAYYSLLPTSISKDPPTPERVLFLHGVQTPALGLQPLAAELHASFPAAHFILLDLWGHGLSDTPVVAHEASLFHGLIDALLDDLEWASAHFVGYSFGGALTVGYVASRSSRVQSFTLVAPAGLLRRFNLSAEDQAQLRGGGDEDAAKKWVMTWLEGGELTVPADWKERAARGEVVAEAVKEWQLREHHGHAASVLGVIRYGGVMDTDANFIAAAQTGIPSLAVLGQTDDVCSQAQLEELGFANVFVVNGAGHGVVRDSVPEVAGYISKFWKQLNQVRSD